MSSSNVPIEPTPETTSNSTVVVAGTSITMQQLQQIHSELTGKDESISRYYDEAIQLTLEDVDSLHHRIMQTWEQYRIVSTAFSFTIYYLRNTKDQFSTFDRARMQIPAGAEPVESVLLKYDLLVVLPNVPKAQTYSISIRIVSRVALEKRMREGPPFVLLPRFIRMMMRHTGSVEITYIDYSVARAFLNAIDEWFKSVPRSPENRPMKFLQAHSHWIPRIGRLATAIMMTFLIAKLLPMYIHADGGNFLRFGRFFLYSGLGIYAACMLAGWSASYAEYAVDSWSSISYIKFNRGDENEITKSAAENRKHLIRGALGVAGMVIVNVVANVIVWALASL